MDPNDYDPDLEEEEASMAAMMGFTSFGPASKKRKYNPRADAAVVGGPPDEDSGTGANTLPLMPRVARVVAGDGGKGVKEGMKVGGGGVGGKGNADEIDLDVDDDEEDGDRSSAIKGKDTPSQSEVQILPASVHPSLPAKPPLVAVSAHSHRQAGGFGGQSQQQQQQQERGPSAQEKRIWYSDYYDPSSNENPWEYIEKARGMEPVGSWLERGHAAGRARG